MAPFLDSIKNAFQNFESLFNSENTPVQQEPDPTIMLEEQTLDFALAEENEWPYTLNTDNVYRHTITDYVYADYPILSDAENKISSGVVFRVVWDSDEYDCVPSYGGMDMLTLGNSNIVLPGSSNDTEPFFIMANVFYETQGLYIATKDTSASHTVKVYALIDDPIQVPSDEDEGVLPIEKGGTNADNATSALYNLGIAVLGAVEFNGNFVVSDGAFKPVNNSLFVVYIPADKTVDSGVTLRIADEDRKLYANNGIRAVLTSITQGYHLMAVHLSDIFVIT